VTNCLWRVRKRRQTGKGEAPVLSGIGQKEDQILRGIIITLIIIVVLALIFFFR